MATEKIKTKEEIKESTNKWTRFWDMNSGGGTKTPYSLIYIEADEKEAIDIFENRFNQDPTDVACECCGQNFEIDSYESLEDATEYHREDYGINEFISIEEYSKKDSVLIIYK